MSRSRSRAAFTLVELLVVITIIGILVALLMPAVQSAREAARRTQCINHLKQIGIAVQNHVSAFEAFPTGGETYGSRRTKIDGTPAGYRTQAWSWGYQLLPYLEQQNLYDHPDDNLVSGTPIPTYFCPSRRSPVALAAGPWRTRSEPRAQTDYAGNAGSSTQGGSRNSGRLGLGHDGVFAQNQLGPVMISAIRDGTSNTMLIGEKRLNGTYADTENQPGDNDGYVGGFQEDVARWGSVPPEQDFYGPHITHANLYPFNFQFGGPHSGAFQAVLCDGSVQTISYYIDPQVFSYICSRNDGQSFSMEGLGL